MNSTFDVRRFAYHWFPLWTGNIPEKIISYYSDDCFYSDPSIPEGVKGKDFVFMHLNILLSQNPNWIWTPIEFTETKSGLFCKLFARIPTTGNTIECFGGGLLQFDNKNKIARSEFYYDRTDLVEEIHRSYKKYELSNDF